MRKLWHNYLGIFVLTIGVAFEIAGCSGKASSTDQKDSEPTATTTPPPVAQSTRNPKWAVPIKKEGLPNLHQIAEGLYRGAQPTPNGFTELHKMGVKTVVNFRALHNDDDEIEEAGLSKDTFNYVSIPINTWSLDDEHVIAFLKVINSPDNYPVFFHCQHGADRTGTMAAVYRIVVDGWSKEDAIDEMKSGGYNYHSIWKNLITYLREMDPEKLKSKL